MRTFRDMIARRRPISRPLSTEQDSLEAQQWAEAERDPDEALEPEAPEPWTVSRPRQW